MHIYSPNMVCRVRLCGSRDTTAGQSVRMPISKLKRTASSAKVTETDPKLYVPASLIPQWSRPLSGARRRGQIQGCKCLMVLSQTKKNKTQTMSNRIEIMCFMCLSISVYIYIYIYIYICTTTYRYIHKQNVGTGAIAAAPTIVIRI